MMSNIDDNYDKCPYCYVQENTHELSKLLNNRKKESVYYTQCLKCNGIYYYTHKQIKIKPQGHFASILNDGIFSSYKDVNITFTQEIYNKKYNNNLLFDYLPTEELKTRLLDLQSCSRINPKYMALRALIDAYIAYKHNRNENTHLATAISDAKKENLISEDAHELLSFINKKSNDSTHSKAHKTPDENILEQAIAFIILMLTEEFHLPKRKEEIELKRKELLEEMENEESQLEQNINNQKENLMSLKNLKELPQNE